MLTLHRFLAGSMAVASVLSALGVVVSALGGAYLRVGFLVVLGGVTALLAVLAYTREPARRRVGTR